MSAYTGPEATERLTERETKQIQRLLSDPTIYPMQLKTWVVSFIEGSDVDLPMQNVHGLLDQLKQLGTPAVSLRSGESFTVFDSAGDPILRIDEDGTFHGRAGKALTFDL